MQRMKMAQGQTYKIKNSVKWPWAWPKAGPAINKKVFWKGPTSTKINFLLKNAVLGHFWPFLDLLDLKNGSGSKFYVIRTRREVWRSISWQIYKFRQNFYRGPIWVKEQMRNCHIYIYIYIYTHIIYIYIYMAIYIIYIYIYRLYVLLYVLGRPPRKCTLYWKT